jgi:hypothetical protein
MVELFVIPREKKIKIYQYKNIRENISIQKYALKME